MKKIIGLSVVFLLILAVAVGGTVAYFQDTETSSANTLTSGTLDLGLANSAGQMPNLGTTQTWYVSAGAGWKPGDSKSGDLYLYNSGSITVNSITVAFDYTVIDGTPATISPIGTDDTDKMEKMIIASSATFDDVTVSDIQGKSLYELKQAGAISLGATLAGHSEKVLAIDWVFDSSATNGCQGDAVDFTLTVAASQ